jgi:hypothetical protein
MFDVSAGKKVVQGLYDYAAGDESVDLSFNKDDFMIVLKQLVRCYFIRFFSD